MYFQKRLKIRGTMADVKHTLRQQGFGSEEIRSKDHHEQDWRKSFHCDAASVRL